MDAGFGAHAIAHYAAMVVAEAEFQPHQHIPELREALRRLARDTALGDLCRACGVPGCACTDPPVEDRPWTPEDQAAFQRTLAHLGVTPDDLDALDQTGSPS
ncbi:hypothetical protein [Microtetraspora fusca]|uniref:hypothetical protein n=1 Tax=Microtetraspora fusca TaxID=1997 RepID=UPI00082BD9EA|nr:hypothetical protein [Microtetraspora fusca]